MTIAQETQIALSLMDSTFRQHIETHLSPIATPSAKQAACQTYRTAADAVDKLRKRNAIAFHPEKL